jgi:hypothetical protein
MQITDGAQSALQKANGAENRAVFGRASRA